MIHGTQAWELNYHCLMLCSVLYLIIFSVLYLLSLGFFHIPCTHYLFKRASRDIKTTEVTMLRIYTIRIDTLVCRLKIHTFISFCP